MPSKKPKLIPCVFEVFDEYTTRFNGFNKNAGEISRIKCVRFIIIIYKKRTRIASLSTNLKGDSVKSGLTHFSPILNGKLLRLFPGSCINMKTLRVSIITGQLIVLHYRK